MTSYERDVFLNCPFDEDFVPIRNAIVFGVTACGFRIRCALETVDSAQNRFDRICKLIRQCRLGIHDLSRTDVDPNSRLPRFNMPFELGLFFLGAQRFGEKQQSRKGYLILDTEPYRYQRYISDLSGQDIVAHHNDARHAVRRVRDWLQSLIRQRLPGSAAVWQLYLEFQLELPLLLREVRLTADDLTFVDHAHLVVRWLQDRQRHGEVPAD